MRLKTVGTEPPFKTKWAINGMMAKPDLGRKLDRCHPSTE